jgi:integrase/recombinase XerD
MSLSLTIDKFVKHLISNNRSHFTITAYRKDLEQLVEFLENSKITKWEDADTKVLNRFITKLINSSELSLKTVSRKINSIRTLYKFLISQKIISENHALKLKHPKVSRHIPRVLTPFEYKALRDTARTNIRLYTIIETLLQTGIRIGELSRLLRDDISRDLTELQIQAYSTYPERWIQINAQLKNTFEDYFKSDMFKKTDSKYVFFTRNGSGIFIRNLRHAIMRAFKSTGIKDAKVNDLRNTFIVYQLEHGIRVEKLASIVGHKQQSTTEYYLELIQTRSAKTTSSITPL